MITLEVTTMQDTTAPASFSLVLSSALLEQTRSPGVNASSQRVKRKRGGTHISGNEWGNVGVASRELSSAPFRDVAADPGFVARRRCQTLGTGLGLAGILTLYRGSGWSEPFGLTLGAAESSLVRIKLRSPSRFFTEHMVPEDHPYTGRSSEVKEQLQVGDPLSV